MRWRHLLVAANSALLLALGACSSEPSTSSFVANDAGDGDAEDAAPACPALDPNQVDAAKRDLTTASAEASKECPKSFGNTLRYTCAGGLTGLASCGIDTCQIYFYDATGALVGIASSSANTGGVMCVARTPNFTMPAGNGAGGFACPFAYVCSDAGSADAAKE